MPSELIDAVFALDGLERLKALLASGANPDEKHEGRTALDWAVTLNDPRKVRALLDHNANPNLGEDPDPKNNGRYITPLIDAVTMDAKSEIVEILLQAGADPNLRDNLSMTPLMSACTHGATHNVKLLIAWKADVEAVTDDGLDALYFAMSRDSPEIVQCLLELGLNPVKQYRSGLTALSKAKKKNLKGTLEVLRKAGYS
jgi:ankyrin repeat protein